MFEIIRILLVEDNPGDAALVEELLCEVNIAFELTRTERLEAAIAELKVGCFDVVLLDLGLPDSTGLDTLRKIIATGIIIPVTVLTGFDDDDAGLQSIKEGAQSYLVKGKFSAALLKSTILFSIERKKLLDTVVTSSKNWQQTFDAVGAAVFLLDNENKIVQYNKAAKQLYCRTGAEISGRYCWEIVHGTDAPIPECPAVEMCKTRKRETRVLAAGGKYLQVSVDPIFDDNGKLTGIVHIIEDVTDREIAVEKQKQYLSLLDATLESTADAIFVVELDGHLKLYNRKFAEMWQIPQKVLDADINSKGPGSSGLVYVAELAAEPEAFVATIQNIISNPECVSRGTFAFKDGHIFEFNTEPQRISGEVVGRVWSFRDITERKLDENRICYLSFHDVLTGLYNRRYFEDELVRMDTARQLPISIISGDVNGLKLTNDVFGHERGDELIRTAAKSIQDCCRAEDVVVRYGGDEFVGFLPKCDEATALEIVDRIQAQCRDKTIAGIPLSLALGVATKNEPTEDINSVVNLAETRMYKNKSSEANRIRLDTLEALERKLYKKDYKADHALRLEQLATEFGKYLRLSDEMILELATLATLHDIGKVGITDEIINKPGPLRSEEWELLKTHSEIGNRILRATRMVSFAVEEAVLLHHEHWDGSGYPKGLKAEAIPFISRVVAIIDAYDVMVHDRPYRDAITHASAIAELQSCAGTQFDPELVAEFVKFVGAGGE